MPWRCGRWTIPRRKAILDLCGGTGSWSAPYDDMGYEVYVVDVDPILRPQFFLSVGQFLSHLKGGTVFLPPLAGILAAPPCTVFSRASSRFWKHYDDTGQTKEAVQVAKDCLEIIELLRPRWWALENPPGRLAEFLGPPAWSFQPWEYGDNYTKQTHIWGTARRPEASCEQPGILDRRHSRLGGSGRKVKTLRSMTPPGFARAFANRNK